MKKLFVPVFDVLLENILNPVFLFYDEFFCYVLLENILNPVFLFYDEFFCYEVVFLFYEGFLKLFAKGIGGCGFASSFFVVFCCAGAPVYLFPTFPILKNGFFYAGFYWLHCACCWFDCC